MTVFNPGNILKKSDQLNTWINTSPFLFAGSHKPSATLSIGIEPCLIQHVFNFSFF